MNFLGEQVNGRLASADTDENDRGPETGDWERYVARPVFGLARAADSVMRNS